MSFGAGSKANQYIHSNLGRLSTSYFLDYSENEAIAFRVKSNADLSFHVRLDTPSVADGTPYNLEPNHYQLLGLDGYFDETVKAGTGVLVPANFDGFVLVYLDTFYNNMLASNAKLNEFGQYVFFMSKAVAGSNPGEYTTAAFTGNEVLSIQSISLVNVDETAATPPATEDNDPTGTTGEPIVTPSVTPSVPATTDGEPTASEPAQTTGDPTASEPADTESAGPSQSNGPGESGDTGAPIVIGAAAAALGSCAYFIARKKKD